jgi:hypothetical protein
VVLRILRASGGALSTARSTAANRRAACSVLRALGAFDAISAERQIVSGHGMDRKKGLHVIGEGIGKTSRSARIPRLSHGLDRKPLAEEAVTLNCSSASRHLANG